MKRRKVTLTQLSCGRCGETIPDGARYRTCYCWGCGDAFCESCLLFLEAGYSKHQAQFALGMAYEVDCLHLHFLVLTEIENGRVFEPIPAPPRGKGE